MIFLHHWMVGSDVLHGHTGAWYKDETMLQHYNWIIIFLLSLDGVICPLVFSNVDYFRGAHLPRLFR